MDRKNWPRYAGRGTCVALLGLQNTSAATIGTSVRLGIATQGRGLFACITKGGRLLKALKLGHADGSYLTQLSQLQKLDLLILDDCGLEGGQGKQITDLLDVIEDRYEQRSTVILTNYPSTENPTVTDALLGRLFITHTGWN